MSIVSPLLEAIRKDLGNILARMHRNDFASPGTTDSSPYLKDLSDKLVFVRSELLRSLKAGEMTKEWCALLCSIDDLFAHSREQGY